MSLKKGTERQSDMLHEYFFTILLQSVELPTDTKSDPIITKITNVNK